MYQVWWKSIYVYSSYHLETKNRRMDGQLMDGHTDVQRETITPRHYCVAGYKNDRLTASDVHLPQTQHFTSSSSEAGSLDISFLYSGPDAHWFRHFDLFFSFFFFFFCFGLTSFDFLWVSGFLPGIFRTFNDVYHIVFSYSLTTYHFFIFFIWCFLAINAFSFWKENSSWEAVAFSSSNTFSVLQCMYPTTSWIWIFLF